MEQNNINLLLEKIKAEQGAQFTCDEENIQSAITSDQQISYPGIAVKILSILGGVFAALAFLGFLFLTHVFDSEIALVILGIILMAASIAGDKKFENILLDTCCITLYVIGFVLFILGVSRLWDIGDNGMMIFSIILAALTLFVTNNYILCLLSVLTANISLMLLLKSNFSGDATLISTLFAGVELALMSFFEAGIISQSPKLNKLFKPVHTGFFISFALGLVYLVSSPMWETSFQYVCILSPFIWAGVIVLISRIISLFEIKDRQKIMVYICCGLALLPTFFAPFISGCLFLLLLSFYFNYKTEIALSIILLIYVISQYYYNLQLSLLEKSGILFFSGILFLLFWLGFHQSMKKNGNL